MSWILLAFCGPVLWAISTHIDKYLVERFFKETGVGTLLIFTSLIGLAGLPIIPAFVNVFSIGTTGVIVTSVSGLLYMTAMYFYLRALQQEEATTIAPLFQTSTLFTYVIAYFVLHETLTLPRIIGGLLVMASAAVIAYDPDHKRKFKLPIVALILACTATLAVSAVIFKFFAIKDAFWPVTFWSFAGEAVFGAGDARRSVLPARILRHVQATPRRRHRNQRGERTYQSGRRAGGALGVAAGTR